MSSTQSQISRRNLLKKSAVAGAVFWSVPVIESLKSRAAAASGTGLTCASAFVFYQHANGQVFLIAFQLGSTGTCAHTGPNTCPATSISGNCNGNSFTLGADQSGTGLPAATANVSNPVPFGPGPVIATTGGGDCRGQFVITGQTITGGSSNVILAAFGIPAAGCPGPPPAGWVCPTSLATGNSVTLTACT